MSSYLAEIIADFQTQLATAIEIGGTTATLQSATDDDGVALPAGRYFFTIDGDNSSKEHIACTLSGTALTAIKTVSRQGTETSGVLRKHRVGATVTITDFKHIKAINDLLDGTTSFDSATPLGYDGTATISTANQLATKAYVDGVAIAGGADASTTVKGISKLSTAPASASNPIAVGDNDGRVPTQSENDALVGTSGTPSSSNKYVTADDVSDAAVTGKIVRATGTALPALSGANLTSIREVQTFTSSGTWTKPSFGTRAFVQVWGAGGAGGGKTTAANNSGGGGGGGAYSEGWFALSALGATVTVTIGAGGVGVSGSNGGVGGNTTFGSHITAYGGGGGGVDVGSGSGSGGGGGGIMGAGNSAVNTTAGAGGTPLGGAAGSGGSGAVGQFGGGGGGDGDGNGGASVYGGGGGSCDTGQNNYVGGASVYGGGGGGGGTYGGTPDVGGTSVFGGAGGAGSKTGAGNVGTQPAGGGGGAGHTNTTAYAGGNGGAGQIIVTVI